jgi:nitroimidazol reductase NimA-like FMN-containing flavoprotein (pyridoxamine 5'-phosphate oxidase superfamily)
VTTNDLTAHAMQLLDANAYLTLGTADAAGRPWVSPVYMAAEGLQRFYWVSAIDARHSLNLAERPAVSLVVFDSTVPPYHGRAVYAEGEARAVVGDELDHALAMYPGPASRGATPVTRDDVTGASPYRLYMATATQVWVLCPREPRMPCALHGLAKDHRTRVV